MTRIACPAVSAAQLYSGPTSSGRSRVISQSPAGAGRGAGGRQHRHHHLRSHGRHHAPGRRQGGGRRQRPVALDYPFERSSQAVSFLRSAHLTATHREKIAHRNAERILRL
ncbi:hypothetical protein ACFQVA_37610 [Actinomadura keratinilytica]